jgi:hypothetical protein
MQRPFSSLIKIEHPLTLLLLIIFFFLFHQSITSIQADNTNAHWVTGDWLINYSAGTIRRGFSGELAIYIHRITGIDLLSAIHAIKISLNLTLLSAVYYICAIKKIGLIELILLLSPALFTFGLNDPAGSGRKEIILFTFFALYSVIEVSCQHASKSIMQNWRLWFLTPIFIIVNLSHEGLFFFFPFFFLLSVWGNSKINHYDVTSFIIAYVSSAITFATIAYFFKGDAIQSKLICENIISHGINSSMCEGAVAALAGFEFSATAGYYKTYITGAVFALIPILIYGFTQTLKIERALILTIFLVITLIHTLPIYYLGADWGRWIHITATLLTITFIANKNTAAKHPFRSHLIATPALALAAWFFMFSWALPHWIHPDTDQFIHQQNIHGWLNNLL